jgi:hypothetical protein
VSGRRGKMLLDWNSRRELPLGDGFGDFEWRLRPVFSLPRPQRWDCCGAPWVGVALPFSCPCGSEGGGGSPVISLGTVASAGLVAGSLGMMRQGDDLVGRRCPRSGGA